MTPEFYGLAVFVLPGFAGSGVFFFLRPTHKLSDFERLAVSLFFSCGAYGFMLIALHGLSAIPNDCSYFSFSESVNPNMDPEIHMDSGTLDVQPLPDGNLNFKVLNVLPHGVYLRSAEIRAVTPLTEPARRT